jgi:glutamate:GABA antiporter
LLCDDLRTMADIDSCVAANSESGVAEHRLHRQLGVWDLTLAQVLCVVGSSWVGVAAGLGKAQTLMWIAAMAVFYLPMAAAVIWLNRAMPLEGGLYVWAHRAFGELGGFLTAWNLWVYGIAVTATILYATPTEIAYLIGPSARWLPENPWAAFGIVALIVAALTVAAIRGLELGKWIHNVGGAAMLTVFAGLIALPFWAMARGTLHQDTLFPDTFHQGMSLTLALPEMNWRMAALFGQMLFGALCGLEYIAIFAGESRNPARTIARSVWIASPAICLMFILGTSSVATFVPREQLDFIAPIPQTMRAALGNTGLGSLVAMTAIVLVEMRLLGAASLLFTGVTRLPLAVGWDALAPEWFTRLDAKRKTPVNSILCAAALVLLMTGMASLGVHAQEANQLLSNASLTHYELTYLAMFAAPIVGTRALRRQMPPWLKWVCGVGFCSTLFSLLISAFPYVDVVNRWAYAGKIVGTVVVSNLIAVGFYAVRKKSGRTRARVKDNLA